MSTYVHTLTPTEVACGVTLAKVSEILPKCLFINGGESLMLPKFTPPALAASVARCAFAGAVDFSHLSNGYPVYSRAYA